MSTQALSAQVLVGALPIGMSASQPSPRAQATTRTGMLTGMRRFARALAWGAVLGASLAAMPARASDAVETLRAFVREVQGGKASFTQVVTAPDGVKKKTSSGVFEFARPNRFRFDYIKPYPQTIVGDGQKVWLHDPDLQQVTVRAMDQALGGTPAALLTGQSLDKDFALTSQPDADGLAWVQAVPRVKDGASFQSMRVGFRGKGLAVVEILDAFGQRTVMQFDTLSTAAVVAADRFTFRVPPNTDVLQQ